MSQSIELSRGGLSAAIDPHGAQLHSLRSAEWGELLWQGDPQYWPDHALVLFPLICQLPGGRASIGGKSYPMPPHGFAQHQDFQVIEQTATRAVFELRDSDETREYYPFAFTLRVEFDLTGDGLLVTLAVENRDDEPMPADVGYHPGFNWPLTPGTARDDYRLVFPQDEPAPIRTGTGDPVMLYPEGHPTPVEGNVLRLTDALVEMLPIVLDQLNSRSVTFGAPGAPGLQVDFPDSPNLAIWTLPGAPYLCIEPWQGLPMEVDFAGPLAEKPDIAIVQPGDTRRWRIAVTLRPGQA